MVANYLFGSSISAIQAQSNAFDAIADNIANATTPGHKAQRIEFRDLVVDAERVPGNIFPALRGTSALSRRDVRAEGGIQRTGNPLDVALNGRGFFVVNNQQDGTGQTLLTDSGQLQRIIVDNAGTEEVYLGDNVGNFVQGWPFDPATNTFTVGTTTASLVPLRIDSGADVFAAQATTTASINANIPPDTTTGDFFNIGLNIFDGSGSADNVNDLRSLNAQFTKGANFNEWTLQFSGTDATVTTPAAPVTVTFDANGAIVAPTSQALAVTWANPAATNNITLDLSDMTSFAPNFVLVDTETNGFQEGTVGSIEILESGVIQANFTNGQNRPLGKIAIGDVVNPNLLTGENNTHFSLSGLNGALQLFEADTSGRVQLFSNSLEDSTTDLTAEVSQIIITQRAYSSAATSLRTIEEMLQTATDLKR